ncbi:hypothetical protein JCM10207_004101 [Rhodosporidiobolus poonsookiae]
MKLSLLLSSLALSTSLALASAIPRDLANALDANTADLAKRTADLDAALEQPDLLKKRDEVDQTGEVELEKRQDGNRGGGGGDFSRPRPGRPDRNYRADGSGRGYGVDFVGNRRPRRYPDGWQWFGRDIGWAPYRGWRPDRRWRPDIIIRIMIKVRWWSPPKDWKQYWYSRWECDWYRYDIPRWWDWRPRPRAQACRRN